MPAAHWPEPGPTPPTPTPRRRRTSLQIELPATGTVTALRSLLDRLDDRDVPVEQLEVSAPDLDDVFFALTTHPTRKALP